MTTLASTLSYSTTSTDPTGAMGLPSSANVGNNTYVYAASHDNAGRLTAVALRTTGGAGRFRSAPTYDAANNVTSVATTLNGTSTDNQAFCYDELNRLVWASSQSGTIPCTGATNTAGTLGGSALYTQSFTYDNLDRLTSGPAGSYSYGLGMQAGSNPSPLHAALQVGSSYTASYDAAGNMVCRAPTSSTTCAGTKTGAQLSSSTRSRLDASSL